MRPGGGTAFPQLVVEAQSAFQDTGEPEVEIMAEAQVLEETLRDKSREHGMAAKAEAVVANPRYMCAIRGLCAVVLMSWSFPVLADDSDFSAHLHAKFQVKACTVCHDFFEKKLGGLAYKSHMGRTPDMCAGCHARDVTGFKEEDDWFAMPGLYTSGMNVRQTCEAVMSAVHAKFKNPAMVARQLKKHLFEDPRVLWSIEGALPNSGMLPEGKRQKDLVGGGIQAWEKQVSAWIEGGMKCE